MTFGERKINMKFRPCIDIHNGNVTQIVGGSLNDTEGAVSNFVSQAGGAFYGWMYKNYNLKGGHIIMLNPSGTPEYEADKREAEAALKAYLNGFMVGGGVTVDNARHFIIKGASHVIVTSYVFKDGKINYENLDKMVREVGKEHLVLDLSCRKKDGKYYIVTDRWQKFTDTELTIETLKELEKYCDEYLIHAVDVEGKKAGIDEELISMLGNYEGIPVTYAGGVASFDDIRKIKEFGKNRVDITIGSALSIFGGDMQLEEVLKVISE